MAPYKATQGGTGGVGVWALRQVLDAPDLELVGAKCATDQKVGLDAGVQGFPITHHYNVSKAGLSAFTKCLAVSDGGYNIRVNAVLLGGPASPRGEHFLLQFQPLLDEASYIHGADIVIDGGQSIGVVPNFGPPQNSPFGLTAESCSSDGVARNDSR
jgi:hypothetical protein